MTSSTISSTRSGDVQLAGAGLFSLLLQTVQLIPLAHIGGHGDDLGVVVVLLQPGDDDRSIQSSGISEDDFFDLRHCNCLLFSRARGPP